MEPTSAQYQTYLAILREELIPAEGCTEPVAVAYAAARCRDLLGEPPLRCTLYVSGPIIKNVKSVVVPHTGGRKGLATAVAAGLLAGDAGAVLQVLSSITEAQQAALPDYLAAHPVEIFHAENDIPFYIDLRLTGAAHEARVVLRDAHTNIVLLERDGEAVWQPETLPAGGHRTDRSCLSIAGILDFAAAVRVEDVRETLERMIACNSAISRRGLAEHWGAEIGRTLLDVYGDTLPVRARAAAAAASDARMSGCELPVVIVSGSGNQGITCTMPVAVYAEALGASREALYRALVVSALITVHQKRHIGPVSAFCGAVCAGVGAGCGIAYLQGADLEAVNHTVVNALSICAGMVCDGAKPSCAAKIAAAVDAGIVGYQMFRRGQQFRRGEGLVKGSAERTIEAVCRMAHSGMEQTDKQILEIMLQD